MQIKAIILYGLNGRVRELSFRLNQVNIITGKSRTGKTALLDIIDYCLGRNTCNVPAGVIRNAVAWYALLLQFPETQAFIARRNPKANQNTSPDIMLEVGGQFEHLMPVSDLAPNITEQGLRDALGRLLGITPNENVPPRRQSRLPLRATIDHAKFLIFQGQSEIANRSTLFHRQEEPFIPQAIKDTLPYFLGALPDESLMLRARLRDAKQELARLHRQKEEADRIVGEGNIRTDALRSEAIEVGLLSQDDTRGSRNQLETLMTAGIRSIAVTQHLEFGEEGTRLRAELSQTRQEYQEVQQQIEAAIAFNSAQAGFEDEAVFQHSRLEVVGLIPDDVDEIHTCPVCNNELGDSVPAASDLEASLLHLRTELEGVGSRRPRVDEYVNQLKSQLQLIRNRMSDVRRRLNGIDSQNRQAQLSVDLERRQALVLGRISLYLESVPEAVVDESLAKRIEALEDEITDLEEKLQNDTVREAVDSALSRVGQWMTEGAKALELEYQPNPYRLDLGLLTVVADTDNRPVRMVQMGSAENWLGCHLIAHVALQKWFSINNRPVPRFLFIDQPTSAYYPPDDPNQGTDEDRAAVARMYKWLINSVHQSRVKFQLIVVDHADLQDEQFQACVVQKWRGGNALIPNDWIALRRPPAPASDAEPT